MPETPVFSTAAVAAPHNLASETGQTILAAGGNAIEAMVAMAATVAVVYPHMNGIGGDGFWLVREPKGRIHALDASGLRVRSPRSIATGRKAMIPFLPAAPMRR
ncbi:gamma-glutamyltransferase [Microvirga arabica]|uniref:gamma-glutamyltransferase n=1 Tax=Microvirga arabica TaxID=1128671 RepID=UPI00361DA27B